MSDLLSLTFFHNIRHSFAKNIIGRLILTQHTLSLKLHYHLLSIIFSFHDHSFFSFINHADKVNFSSNGILLAHNEKAKKSACSLQTTTYSSSSSRSRGQTNAFFLSTSFFSAQINCILLYRSMLEFLLLFICFPKIIISLQTMQLYFGDRHV